MSESKIDIVLLGQCQPGKDAEKVVYTLARLLNTEVAVVRKIMAKGRQVIKKDADEVQAKKYKSAIERAGGICELVEKNRHIPAVGRPEEIAAEPVTSSVRIAGVATASNPYGAIATKAKNKNTAGLLALFLGGHGMHRFYLGQWWGIFYLLFWGTLIPSIVSLVEAIVFFRTPGGKWDRKYGRVSSSKAVIVSMIVGGFLYVAITGVLVAIALPAYQEYTAQKKVQSAMSLIHETRNTVTDFIQRTGTYPNRNLEAGLPGSIGNKVVKSIVLEDYAKMVVTFNIPSLGGNNTIEWIPVDLGKGIEWNCIGGSMSERLRPRECRDAGNQVKTSQGTGDEVVLHQKYSSKDGRFSINVPARWSRMDDLNEDAALGVGNLYEHVYFIVVEEPKLDFEEGFSLEDYTNLTQSMRQEASNQSNLFPDRHTLTIGDMHAEQFTFSSSVDGVKITYLLTTIEVEDYFYQIIGWTLASKFADKEELMRVITGSFKIQSTLTPVER